jgi:glyoxylase-like metal-dependent hydrolase (beta-lactamase superfamily II)
VHEFNPITIDLDTVAMKSKSWKIGDVRLTRIMERGEAVDAHFFLEGVTREFVKSQSWLRPHFATDDGQTIGVRQTFLIESQGLKILVDTCVGNDKVRSVPLFHQLNTSYLDDLEAAGCTVESVDCVLCTHMHVDHVGWNTRLVDGHWVPTFPNARYLFAQTEWDYWVRAADVYAEGVIMDGDILRDSVQPVVDAGLVDFVATDHVITPEVRLIPTPGHTPGHVSVEISSRGRKAIITGDMMHHPIQCCVPNVVVPLDDDTPMAQQTRRDFLSRYADEPVVIFGTHFAHPTAGWIRAYGDSWRFDVGSTIGDNAELELGAEGKEWHLTD